MSHKLISLNPDLKRLRDEGYNIEILNAHLVVRDIPYVNAQKEVVWGILVTPIEMAGERTRPPKDHVILFSGDQPCDKDGNPLKGILHTNTRRNIAPGLDVDRSFSNKPKNGYPDYFEKVTTYTRIIEHPAQAINPSVTARSFRVSESDDPDSVFRYIDSNSSRAGIDAVANQLRNLKVAIIGLGGTGSYLLDFISKTPVSEIYLFDGDEFLSHNAFRAPGAASLEELNTKPRKVAYFHNIYSRVHKSIIITEEHITDSNIEVLDKMDFVFICIDSGESKKMIITKLLDVNIPFIDVGIGINEIDGKLIGSVRTTCVTKSAHDHINKYVSLSDDGNKDYEQNIQIAEINAINAALAVIKMKKLFGFYADLGKENNSIFDINVNKVINDEIET